MSDGDHCAPFSRDRRLDAAWSARHIESVSFETLAALDAIVPSVIEQLQQEATGGLARRDVTHEALVDLHCIARGIASPFASGITVGERRFLHRRIAHRRLIGGSHCTSWITFDGLLRNGL